MIDAKLLREIKGYCELNGLNVEEYVNYLLKKAFMIEKYGDKPSIFTARTTQTSENDDKTKKEEAKVETIVVKTQVVDEKTQVAKENQEENSIFDDNSEKLDKTNVKKTTKRKLS